MEVNRIICGKCEEVMKGFPDNSIDTIITDPPYGIGFMGKEWDNFKPAKIDEAMDKDKRKHTQIASQRRSNTAGSYDLSPKGKMGFQKWMLGIAEEMLRVTKPGGTLLIFGGTRTYHRLACAIEDAGWILKDCIMWIYGSGFPKASDISKQMDKEAKIERKCLKTRIKVNKDLFNEEHEREVIEKGTSTIVDISGRNAIRNGEFQNHTPKEYNLTLPATPEAILWNGWKSHGLKPAYEPILVAMKPNEGSYANNALKWGVAGLNIEGGRISFNSEKDKNSAKVGFKGAIYKEYMEGQGRDLSRENPTQQKAEINNKGRYPANIILDEEAGRLLDEQSGNTSVTGKRRNPLKGYHQPEGGEWFGRKDHNGAEYQDTGGASRFFYCAKASKAERNRGLIWTEDKKMGYGGKEYGMNACEYRPDGSKRKSIITKNNHPTVKPLALMKYLVTLTKMPNPDQIYLDPFCGSGTTLIACKELKRNYIGIDNEKDYVKISECRVGAVPETLF